MGVVPIADVLVPPGRDQVGALVTERVGDAVYPGAEVARHRDARALYRHGLADIVMGRRVLESNVTIVLRHDGFPLLDAWQHAVDHAGIAPQNQQQFQLTPAC